jgi:hypothetical protein
MSHHYSGPDFGFPHGDARLDLPDLYAFPKPGEAGRSILIMNVHPSALVNPPRPTTAEPFRWRHDPDFGRPPRCERHCCQHSYSPRRARRVAQ